MKKRLIIIFIISIVSVLFAKGWIKTQIIPLVLVEFPSEVDKEVNGQFEIWGSENEKCYFMVVTMPMPEKYTKDINRCLENTLRGSLDAAKAKLISKKDLKMGEILAKDVIYQYRNPTTGKLMTRSKRIFLLDNTLFSLECWYKVENDNSCEVDKNLFFNSVKIKK